MMSLIWQCVSPICASSLYVGFEARRESPVPAMMLIGECVQVASDNAAVVANTAALVRASCLTELLTGVYKEGHAAVRGHGDLFDQLELPNTGNTYVFKVGLPQQTQNVSVS